MHSGRTEHCIQHGRSHLLKIRSPGSGQSTSGQSGKLNCSASPEPDFESKRTWLRRSTSRAVGGPGRPPPARILPTPARGNGLQAPRYLPIALLTPPGARSRRHGECYGVGTRAPGGNVGHAPGPAQGSDRSCPVGLRCCRSRSPHQEDTDAAMTNSPSFARAHAPLPGADPARVLGGSDIREP